jgi:hypothetical protein
MPGTYATLCSICNFTTRNPVHTEELKPLQPTTPSPTSLINARQGKHPPKVQQTQNI